MRSNIDNSMEEKFDEVLNDSNIILRSYEKKAIIFFIKEALKVQRESIVEEIKSRKLENYPDHECGIHAFCPHLSIHRYN